MTRTALPTKGRPAVEILTELKDFSAGDPDYKHGRLWSLVYYLDEDYADFLGKAYQQFASANGLNPTAFKSLKRFENEIIAAVAELFHGTPEVCGVVTSGGTESCLLAVKTYRDMARAERRVKNPEMVLPVTAHVAWFKAAEYFDVKVRLLPLDKNLRADVKKLKGLINRNTVMILGSAPEYPHGTIDPIAEFGKVAQQHKIPLHVDACVGGFILPFIAMNGREVPLWDYRVQGVTSISADIHKYGFAAKGASTITYRNLNYLKHQMFVYEDWPGGIFASPALLGTRPGGAYSAAWAAMQYMGTTGYRDLARKTCKALDALRNGIAKIPELYVMGDPAFVVGPLLAYGSRDAGVNIFAVGDQMDAKGWKINRLQNPDGLHAMITAQHTAVTADYLRDLKAAVATVKANPELAKSGSAATYGLMSHLPLRGMVRSKVLETFAAMYRAGGGEVDLDAAHETPQGGLNGLVTRLAHWVSDVAAKRQHRQP
ncbi:MAG: aspartate aminotransferase family protein [Rhodocyclaceae bacterium]|nr:aspartate aminotransferase family protein [Rhodocyclaceae bacterium]